MGTSWMIKLPVLLPEKMPEIPFGLLPITDCTVTTSGCRERNASILPTLSLVTSRGVPGGLRTLICMTPASVFGTKLNWMCGAMRTARMIITPADPRSTQTLARSTPSSDCA